MPDTIAKRISPTEQGLFTARAFQESETIVTEDPLVSIPVKSRYMLGTMEVHSDALRNAGGLVR